MSQASDTGGADLPPAPPPEAPSRTFAWYEVWIKMLTRPSVQSYQELHHDSFHTLSTQYRHCIVSHQWIWVETRDHNCALVGTADRSVHPDHIHYRF